METEGRGFWVLGEESLEDMGSDGIYRKARVGHLFTEFWFSLL